MKWQTDRTIEKNDELHKLKGTIQSEVDKALAKERREVIDGIIGGYWTEPKLNHVVQWLQGRMSPKKVERLQCPNCHTDFFQFKMEKQP